MNNQENKQKYEETQKIKKNSYKSDILTAYGIGYAKGWDDSYTIPNRFGATTAAAFGYKRTHFLRQGGTVLGGKRKWQAIPTHARWLL